MVNTRSQTSQDNQNREGEINDYDDNSSDMRLPEFSNRTFQLENNVKNFSEQEREHARIRIERRCNEMNKQIGELTSLVRTLIISLSDREENGSNLSRKRSQDTLTPGSQKFPCFEKIKSCMFP